jgi:hypothetical protein
MVLPMLLLVAALLLSAEPVLVVVPFEVMSQDPADANLGRALQSLVEADLKAAGVQIRTEDDLDAKNWGKIQGASHVVAGSIVKMLGKVKISARLIALPNTMVASASLDLLDPGEWNGRQRITLRVLNELKKPVPPALGEIGVDDALIRAWGDALRALHDGDPAAAKQKVADVVKRWPLFAPAKERLAQL